jgi:ketosteroid isomerase-like protein
MKRFGVFGILLLAAWPLTAAPGSHAPGAPATTSAGTAGVQQLNDAFLKALQAGDIDGIMKLYAADAVLFPPGEKVAKGPEEIRFKWNNLIEANKISETGLKDAKYVGSPTVSAGWGDVSMKLEPKNGKPPKTIQGRFSTVAEKRNGKWAYVFVGIGELDEILTLDHYSKSK